MIPSLQIKLFGSPSINLDGTPLSGFISSKVLALVYYLAATGQPQAREVLSTLLWTNSPEFYASKNLRNVLSNLRDKLEPFLEISRTVVALKLEQGVQVDSQTFLEQVQAAGKLPPRSPERQRLLAEAAVLYRGSFLDGFTVVDANNFEEWVQSERQHYTQLAIQVLQELVADTAHQGQLLQAIDYANRLLALDPLREETHRQLMLLLALHGQTEAALQQYRTCQQLLHTEFGVEPSNETRQLYTLIQAGELRMSNLVVQLTSSEQPVTPGSGASPALRQLRHNLPAEVTTFVGRDQEVAQIYEQLADPASRLLTLVGMGGIGKTRLALHVAHGVVEAPLNSAESAELQAQFADGIYFVALAAVEATPQVESVLATTIADTLGLALAGARTPAAQLTQALYDKRLLLILDNFEHLTRATPFVSGLLQGARHVKILVTSRARLNVRGEAVIHLTGLALPALPRAGNDTTLHTAILQNYSAIQLFVQRAQTATNFTFDAATLPCVVQICQLLQGMPLALELAATWTRLLACDEIVAELKTNLDFLEDTLTDLPIQQRSLRAVFDHSWRLLSPQEQQSLRRLTVFRGSFTRSAAATVTDTTLPLLAALVDKSLLHASDPSNNPGGPSSGSVVRYELVELVRQYAAEQLTQADESEIFQARHATWVAAFLAGQQADLESARQQEALRTIHAEIENIRRAWQWLLDRLQDRQWDLVTIEPPIAQSFAALFHFYDMRSWFQEGEEVFRQLASHLLARSTWQLAETEALARGRLQANAQARQGWFAFHLGRYRQSRTLLEESLRQLRALGAEQDTIFNLNYLGAVLRHDGDYSAAQAHLQEALRLAQTHHDPLNASIALNTLGQVASLQGQWAEARTLLHQALAIKRQIGDRWGLTYSLTYLGRVAQATGDHTTAHKLFHESGQIYQELGDQRGAAFARRNLGDSAQAVGQVAEATAHYQASLRLYQEIGNRAEASLTLTRLGEIAYGAGEFAVAQEYLHTALALAQAVQSTPGQLAAVLGLAGLALAMGQPAQAQQPLQIVYQHPASNQVQKEQAAQWLADNSFSPAAGADLDLTTYVQFVTSAAT